MAPEKSQQRIDEDLAMLVAIFFVMMLVLSIAPMLSDGDTGWHIAAGQWIIGHSSVPTTDPFSFTFGGKPWLAHEWLSEIVMAASYDVAGWSGVTLLFAGATATLFLILGIEIRRWLPSLPAFVMLLAVFLLLRPYLFARPHLLALPILAAWGVALLRAREEGRAPPLALAALMVVWANMHGSFLFGLALIAPFSLEALIAADRKDRLHTLSRWAAFGLPCVIASMLTPHGPEGLLFPLQVSTMETLPLILEWRGAQFDHVSGLEVVLLGFLLFALSKGLKLPMIRLLVLLGLMHLGLQHVRHQMILAVIGALILAEPIGRALKPSAVLPKPHIRAELAGRMRAYAPAAMAILLIVATIATVRLMVPLRRADGENVPTAALDHIPVALRGEPVFNNYSFGGSLILAGIRPYIDGRADIYGDAFIKEYSRLSGGQERAWRNASARWKFRWTFLSPEDGLVKRLDRDPAWRRIYRDEHAVIHVLRSPR